MVRQKDSGPAGAGRSSAAQKLRKKNRHYNDHDRPHIPTAGLVARPALPKSKHKTILEWTENTDKKKKLEIEFTTNKNPNANFSFVPIGNPELTSLCKELSREQGALVYIVSTTKEKGTDLSDHVHRIGYHFRTHIVEQATTVLEGLQPIDLTGQDISQAISGNKPDPIPESQEEINKQADAAIRDLFPRIPNTDREMIVRHAFQKGAVFNGKPVVGLQADLTLSRRVQLAVIAHIRHTHTRYDLLLRETSWESARRTVESLCLDILVKWRGDEETGRDQLDEVLREIVVIDDSDDEDDDESEAESESEGEGEEEDSSDGVVNRVAEVGIERTDATAVPPRKLLLESQTTQPAQTQINNNPQTTNLINPLAGSQGIAFRTRSKTKPTHRQKLKKSRRNKRYQAWQDALKRRVERPSGPKTPLDQIPRASVRGLDESPRLTLNRTPVGQNSELYTAPHNNEYQTIYAIDNSRGSSKPTTHLASSRRIDGPSDFKYRAKKLTSPQIHDAPSLKYRHSYDARPSPIKTLPFNSSELQQSYATSRRDLLPSQDMALPSIEPAMDLTNQSPARINSYGPIRHSQVTYQEVEPEGRILPTHTKITYVSNWEDNQSKRRRVVLADDRAHVPALSSTTDGYVRLVPISRTEQPTVTAPSLRRVVEVRDGRDHHDGPIMIDHRLDSPRYIQRVAHTRDQNAFSSMSEFRGSAGTDRERRIITIDDSSPQVRMVKRSPGLTQSYTGHQHTFEPQPYESQRVEGQHYFNTSRPAQSMQDPYHENNRLIDPNQSVQPVLYARGRPSYQQRVAEGSSTSLSAFSNQLHSREVNSGLVSYPILSRPHHDYESRFSSSGNQPTLVGTKPSHQFLPESFSAHDFERLIPKGREENRKPADLEGLSRVERHYIPIDSQDRTPPVEPQYIPIDSPDMVRRIIRQRPTNMSGLNEPTYVRKLPYKDEVIVLSP